MKTIILSIITLTAFGFGASAQWTQITPNNLNAVTKGSVAFVDIDGDNDQDLLITGDSVSKKITKLYTNNGSGNFTEVTGTPFDGVHYSAIAFADVDGDNDQDVLITGNNTAYQKKTKL